MQDLWHKNDLWQAQDLKKEFIFWHSSRETCTMREIFIKDRLVWMALYQMENKCSFFSWRISRQCPGPSNCKIISTVITNWSWVGQYEQRNVVGLTIQKLIENWADLPKSSSETWRNRIISWMLNLIEKLLLPYML